MTQMICLLMEDREAARTERNATLATLQHLAQIAVNPNDGNDNGDYEGQGRSKLRVNPNDGNTNPPVFSKSEQPLDAMIGSVPWRTT